MNEAVSRVGGVASARAGRADGFGRRTGALLLFLAPVAWLGVFVGVAAHEILGHGLTALALGGEFRGFVLWWDGMGYAFVRVSGSAPVWHDVLVLAAGAGATIVVGGLLLVLAWRVRRPPWRMALAVLAAFVLFDSALYTIWSALRPEGHGDAGRIVTLTGSGVVPVLLVTAGVALTILATWAPFTILLEAVGRVLGPTVRTSRARRALVVLLFFLLPVIGQNYLFDWEQLVPDVGMLPAHTYVPLGLAFAIWFYFRFPAREGDAAPVRMRRGIVTTWTLLAVTLAAVLLRFSDGVVW